MNFFLPGDRYAEKINNFNKLWIMDDWHRICSPLRYTAEKFFVRQRLNLQRSGQFAEERDLCHSLRLEKNTRSGKLNEWEAREKTLNLRFSETNL
jgi:hypothetical protein